ncbi:MAG: HPr family phosphocarrier protein [Chloroflexi bacterium]|jgi:phosphocarrier protein HPr|nr:HPr family phosphocarrier protein [Anaerolineaceae bacterium]NMB87884.1 HPr family phosphocarrier protein [Chloroflexota bacterium]
MKKAIIRIVNEVGLHARPASILVQQVNKFESKVSISNYTLGSKSVDAKSILGILTLGIEQGHEVALEIEGKDEESAITKIKGLIESDFVGYL